jgi:hypothetical protein
VSRRGKWGVEFRQGSRSKNCQTTLIDREAMSLLCGFTGEPKEVSPVGVSRPKIYSFGVE